MKGDIVVILGTVYGFINVSQILNNVSQVNFSNYICYHIRQKGQVCDAERDLLAMA